MNKQAETKQVLRNSLLKIQLKAQNTLVVDFSRK